MSNLKIIWDNYIDSASLSSTGASFVSTLPLNNLTLQGRSTIARTTTMGTVVVNCNFETINKPVGGLALWNHNLSSVGRIQFELFDGVDQGGSLVYDSGLLDYDSQPILLIPGGLGEDIEGIDDMFKEWPTQWVSHFFDEVTAASFRLTWYDSSSVGYMQASRLVVGPVFSPTYNADYGVQMGWAEEGEQEISQGGSILSTIAVPSRVITLDLNNLSESERAELSALRRRIGKRRDIFFSLYPDADSKQRRDYEMLCKITSTDLISAPYYNAFANRLQLRET